VAAATPWSPSWPWPPARCWPAPGRSPRSPNGPPRRPSRCGRAGARRDAPDHLAVPAEAIIRRTPGPPGRRRAGRRHRRLAGRPGPAQTRAASRWQAVAVDGKTLRGARTQTANGDDRPVHLLAAMEHQPHDAGPTPGRWRPEEVPAFQPLLAALDLAGTVITADALQTHPQAAEFLVTRKHAHCLLLGRLPLVPLGRVSRIAAGAVGSGA
jgi:hypothetical protein